MARAQGNVLVHCVAGVSRSVSLVLAYLIQAKGLAYQDAYSRVKVRRAIIHPNDGFIAQLKSLAQRQAAPSLPPKQPSYLDLLRRREALTPAPKQQYQTFREGFISRSRLEQGSGGLTAGGGAAGRGLAEALEASRARIGRSDFYQSREGVGGARVSELNRRID